jgi:hypothetical protein
MIDTGTIGTTLGWVGTACWCVCFWWMHRISSRQDSLMKELHEMTARIERLSKAEHDLIREVHPVVGDIKQSVDEVAQVVTDRTSSATRK